MAKKFQLQVPEPCHENWDKMIPVDRGRFCDSCQKAVVDFIGMSDAQLIAYFKKPSTGTLCGRFNNDQLEREIFLPKKRIPWFKYILQLFLPVFLTNTKAISQGEPKFKTKETIETCTKTFTDETIVVGQMALPTSKNQLIGKVVNEDGEPIPFASVFIKGSKKGVNCDANGYFEIKINPRDKFITIVTSSIGYEQNEKFVSNNTGSINKIVLKEVVVNSDIMIKGRLLSTGIVAVSEEQRTLSGMAGGVCVKYVEADSILATIKNFFVKDSIYVFPNPAQAGNEIKIQWKKTDVGDHAIELYNLQGQLIQSKPIKIGDETMSLNFRLPLVPPGTYILRITSKKTGKKHVEKIIIR